jgi:hypothetical protein
MIRGMTGGAETAFPGSVDDAGVRLDVRSTAAELHRGKSVEALMVFPGSADDAGVRLQARMTRADAERGRTTESLSAGLQAAR